MEYLPRQLSLRSLLALVTIVSVAIAVCVQLGSRHFAILMACIPAGFLGWILLWTGWRGCGRTTWIAWPSVIVLVMGCVLATFACIFAGASIFHLIRTAVV